MISSRRQHDHARTSPGGGGGTDARHPTTASDSGDAARRRGQGRRADDFLGGDVVAMVADYSRLFTHLLQSVIANARVEHAVHDVGDHIEHHHQEREREVIAMMTGMSLFWIEVISSEPMPGTRKICSVISAPEKTVGA